jgi:hypothetical protein
MTLVGTVTQKTSRPARSSAVLAGNLRIGCRPGITLRG